MQERKESCFVPQDTHLLLSSVYHARVFQDVHDFCLWCRQASCKSPSFITLRILFNKASHFIHDTRWRSQCWLSIPSTAFIEDILSSESRRRRVRTWRVNVEATTHIIIGPVFDQEFWTLHWIQGVSIVMIFLRSGQGIVFLISIDVRSTEPVP